MKPRLLDLFCGAGGCTAGYQEAGFYVVGVDNRPQPNYCGDEFYEADALAILRGDPYIAVEEFDVIHASPPCQAYTLMRHMGKRAGESAPDLVGPTRELLEASGLPWVMENVVGSPLAKHIVLCGSMFGLGVRRHRIFESSHLLLAPQCQHGAGWPVAVWGDGRPSRKEARREHCGPIAVYGDHPEDSPIHRSGDSRPGLTRRAATLAVGQVAMGIDWMNWRELTQSIPPAYTELIGHQLMSHLARTADFCPPPQSTFSGSLYEGKT